MTGAEALGCTESEHRTQFDPDQALQLLASHEFGYELLKNTEVIFVPA